MTNQNKSESDFFSGFTTKDLLRKDKQVKLLLRKKRGSNKNWTITTHKQILIINEFKKKTKLKQ